MASVEHEPVTGFWAGPPVGYRGREPLDRDEAPTPIKQKAC